MLNPKDFLDTKEKKKLTLETFKIWELGFRAGYNACIEDIEIEKKIVPTKVTSPLVNEINLVLNLFKKINPTINYQNKTERWACLKLLQVYGKENIEHMINDIESIVWEQYAPVITTPYELLNKVSKLEIYLNKKK